MKRERGFSRCVIGFLVGGAIWACLAAGAMAASPIESQADLVKARILARDLAGAESACAVLLERFGSDPALPGTALALARAYRDAGWFAQAGALCRHVLQKFPQGAEAARAWAELAVIETRAENAAAARAALDTLRSVFRPESATPDLILDIARVWRELECLPEARALCHYLILNYPRIPEIPRAWVELAFIETRAKNEPDVVAALNALKTAFAADRSLADELMRVAEDLLRQRRCEQARDLYQRVMEAGPLSDAMGVEALTGLAEAALILKDRAGAQAAVARLFADFAGHPDVPKTLFEIGKKCRQAEWNDEAFAIWREIVSRRPEDPYAFWAQVRLATENIALKNETESAAAIEGLFAVFSNREELPGRVNRLARECMDNGFHEKALALSRRMLQAWPEHTEAIWGHSFQVEAHARLGNTVAADAAAAVLLERYQDDPRLSGVYYQIGHRLFKGENLPPTIKIPERAHRAQTHSAAARPYLEYFLQRWPDDPNALSACSELAIARLWARDEAGEDEAVKRMFADFAEHPRLYATLLRIAEQRILWSLLVSYPERGRRLSRADELLVRMRAGHPNPEDVETNARACFLLAYSAYHQSRLENSLALCEESFVRWPDYGKQYEARIQAAWGYSGLFLMGIIPAEEATAAVQRLYDAQAADTKAPQAYYRNQIAKALEKIRSVQQGR